VRRIVLVSVLLVASIALASPHPGLVPPDVDHVGQVWFDEYTYGCVVGCPGKARCLVKTRKVACPAKLLPHLADGVAPTRKKGKRCWYGAIRVACP
jgi:hypothetical protein